MSITLKVPNLNPRFLSKNLAVPHAVASDAASGFVTAPRPTKRGTGRLHASEGFTGQSEADYVVEITALQTFATGLTFSSKIFDGSVGIDFQYRWGRQFSDNSGLTFIDHGVSGTTISSSLEQGIEVNFQFDHPGVTFIEGDFKVGDRWSFKARNPNHINSASRYPRDMRFKSTETIATGVIVGLTNQSVPDNMCLAILDHNIADGGAIIHQIGNQTTAIAVSNPDGLSRRSDRLYFSSQPFPIHTIAIVTFSGQIEPHEFGHLYLGGFDQLKRKRDSEHTTGEIYTGSFGNHRSRQLDYRQKVLSFSYPLMVVGLTTNTDMALVRQLKERAAESQGQKEPIVIDFANEEDNEISLFWLDEVSFAENAIYADMFNVEMSVTEVPDEDLS